MTSALDIGGSSGLDGKPRLVPVVAAPQQRQQVETVPLPRGTGACAGIQAGVARLRPREAERLHDDCLAQHRTSRKRRGHELPGDMTNYLSYFLTPSLALTMALAAITSAVITFALRTRLRTTPRRLTLFTILVSVAGIVQFTLLRETPQESCAACLAQWPVDRFLSGQLGPDVMLNAILFIPLGFLATLLWKAPIRVIAGSALLSLAIEILQPLIGVGSNDLMDLAANTFGALLGSGVATAVLIARDRVSTGRLDGGRLRRLLACCLVVTSLAGGLSVGGSTIIQSSGATQLHEMFDGTTLRDYRRREEDWEPQLRAFWQANRMPTADAHSSDTVALHRFTWTFYWSTRCVTARWTDNGFGVDQGQGAQCAQPLA